MTQEPTPTGGDRPEPGAAPGGEPETGADAPVIDADVIAQLASITDSSGVSVLRELLQAFLSAAPGRIDALDHAVRARDLGAVADEAHALTGSSASFGARGLAALCRQLRAAAEHDDLQETRALVERVRSEYQRVQASLLDLSASA